MKIFSKGVPLLLLAPAACLLGGSSTSISLLNSASSILARAQLSETVPLSLPTIATVTFKGGQRALSGTVTQLTPRGLILQDSSNPEEPIPLSRIEKVKFDKNSRTFRPNGEILIRGGNGSVPSTTRYETWGPVPLASFKMKNVSIGQAEVALNSSQYRGTIQVAKDVTYVADEMRFNLQKGTITLKTSPVTGQP